MTAAKSARARGVVPTLGACAASLVCAGCVTYTPAQLAAMQTVDICEMAEVQSYNLAPETRSAVQTELTRRNESCSQHSSTVARRLQDFLDQETYGKQSP